MSFPPGRDAGPASAETGPLPRPDLPDRAASVLRRQIVLGQLPPGAVLPSERELALEFGVNRATMREALGQLERSGLLARRQGSRAVVLDFRRTGTLELLTDVIGARRRGDPGRRRAEQSVLELVAAIYAEGARLAARRRGPADLAALKASTGRMRAVVAGGDHAGFTEAQRDFQRQVMAATGSVAFELAANTIHRASPPAGQRSPAGDAGRSRWAVVVFYEALLAAIEDGRADDAAGLVRAAMTAAADREGPASQV